MKEHTTHHDGCECYRDRILDDVIAMFNAERERLIMLRLKHCGHELNNNYLMYTMRASCFDMAAQEVENMKR